MDWLDWYNTLDKPGWTPAPATIGLIWRILYPIIFVSFGSVFVQVFRGKLPRRVAWPLAINLVANLIFTTILFTLRSLPLALADIVVVWGTIVWTIVTIWPFHRWVAAAQLPYLAWVSTATILQFSITVMNWGART